MSKLASVLALSITAFLVGCSSGEDEPASDGSAAVSVDEDPAARALCPQTVFATGSPLPTSINGKPVTLNLAGQITSIDGAPVTYDLVGHPSKIAGKAIKYDWGGRVSQVGDATVEYGWLSNRVDKLGERSIDYDLAGRFSSVDGKSVEYDLLGRVSKLNDAPVEYGLAQVTRSSRLTICLGALVGGD